VDRWIIQRCIRRYGNVDWFHVAKKKALVNTTTTLYVP
jgi:hypothetical protein